VARVQTPAHGRRPPRPRPRDVRAHHATASPRRGGANRQYRPARGYSPQSTSSGGASTKREGSSPITSSSALHSRQVTTSPRSTPSWSATCALHSGHMVLLHEGAPPATSDQLQQRSRLDNAQRDT